MSEQPNLRIANLKMAANVFFRTVFSAILCIILYMSLTMIFTGMFTKSIGERLVEYDEAAGTTTVLSEIYYSNTTTTAQTTASTMADTTASTGAVGEAETSTGANSGTESTAAGGAAGEQATTSVSTATSTTTTLPSNQRWEPIRTEVPAATKLVFDIIAQVLMLILLVSLPYSKLWMQGDKDSNLVQFGHMAEDKLRGLKVGLMAGIPSFILYLILLLSKLGLVFPKFIFTYRLFNFCFMPVFNGVIGTTVKTTPDVSWLSMLVLLVTVVIIPFVCWLAYLLGYKHIAVSEKLVYVNPQKKKKRRR